MLTTIIIGSCISVQGELVGRLPDGRVLVRDGLRVYRGRPIGARDEQGAPRAAEGAAA